MGIFGRKKNRSAPSSDAASIDGKMGSVERPLPPSSKYVELGTIEYCNLTRDLRHGDYEAAIAAAEASGKPIFANFVEWEG